MTCSVSVANNLRSASTDACSPCKVDNAALDPGMSACAATIPEMVDPLTRMSHGLSIPFHDASADSKTGLRVTIYTVGEALAETV